MLRPYEAIRGTETLGHDVGEAQRDTEYCVLRNERTSFEPRGRLTDDNPSKET